MKIGFIDYYLSEWHANNYPKFFSDASDGEITVGSAYGEIPSPITGMTSAQWCEQYGGMDRATVGDRCCGIFFQYGIGGCDFICGTDAKWFCACSRQTRSDLDGKRM